MASYTLICHQMITQQEPQATQGFDGGHPKITIFQLTHARLKSAKSSPVEPDRVGNLATGTAVMDCGAHMKMKKWNGTTYRQWSL